MLKPSLRRLLDRLLLVPALVLVVGPVQAAVASVVGDVFYVSGAGDDMGGDGSEASPWRTISHAMEQAGGAALTVHVGAGTYDEDAGESFPIFIDEASLVSVAVVGPGDGSATVNTAHTGKVVGGSPSVDFLLATERITGEVAMSGLTIEGMPSGGSKLVGEPPAAVSLYNGAGSVSVQDNEVSGIGLLVFSSQDGEDASVLLEDNTVVDFLFSRPIEIECSVSSTSANVDQELTIRGNSFISSADRDIGDVFLGIGQGGGHQTVVIENNTMEGCGDLQVEVMAYSGASVHADVTISGNEGQSCDDGIRAYAWANYGGVINGSIDVQNNTLSMKDGAGIICSTGVSSGGFADVDVMIDGNVLVGGDRGIRAGGYASSSYSSSSYIPSSGGVVRDFVISNNQISDMLFTGMYFGFSDWSRGFHGENAALIDGNTITSSGRTGAILEFREYFSVSGTLDLSITGNDISHNGGDYDNEQLRMSFGAYTDCALSASVEVRGNVLGNDSSTDRLMWLTASVSSSALLNLSLNSGGTLYGYNTFSPRSSSTTNSVSIVATSSVEADLHLNGNWWGTTDVMAVEAIVYHGADSSSLAVVDLSSPLADALEFEASKSGNKIRLTASEGSGFVAYAGSTLIEVTVDGVVEDDVSHEA